MKILQINEADNRGGAAQVAYNLHKSLNKVSYDSSLYVNYRFSNNEKVHTIHNSKLPISKYSNFSKRIIKKDLPSFLKYNIRRFRPKLFANDIENFHSDKVFMNQSFDKADIVHLHNLHGYYFDLPSLLRINKNKKIVWTLHDMWSITGHCAHSFDCDRWQIGCGKCPDIRIYPSMWWDNTVRIWKKKKEVYDQIKLNIVSPSNWLFNKLKKSILKNQQISIINNGIDTNIFYSEDKNEIKKELGLPSSKRIILFVAAGGIKNEWKGGAIFNSIVSHYNNKNVQFICIGKKKGDNNSMQSVVNLEYTTDQKRLSKYYAVADLFLFTSLAENFPLVILEAMACGTPIVSFDVGGVKEALIHKENGYIAKYKNTKDLINGIDYIFNLNENELTKMSVNSRKRVVEKFSLKIMTDNYIKLYNKILNE